jgi:DNA-binding FrmR family transcriptional regulator
LTAWQADRTCEHLVTQTLAVEKGMASLIQHMIGGYLQHQVRDMLEENSDEALEEVQWLFELLKK